MPRNYQRKTQRQLWTEVNMAGAVREIISGTMGYLKASKHYHVPQSTLESRVKKARRGESLEEASKKGMGRYKAVFTTDQESELINCFLQMKSGLFSLTFTELRSIAYELAVRKGLKHPFNNDHKLAGKDWLYGLLERYKQISLKSLIKPTVSRVMAFNRPAVHQFFDLLKSLYERHKFAPNDIYAVGEFGITISPDRTSKLLALRGKRHVEAQNGVVVTVETCISAAGIFMPIMYVFPSEKENARLMHGAPPGSSAEYHKSGLMQKDTFVKWFRKFILFSNPFPSKPVLLLLDGHSAHTKSIELLHVANENNVILLSFPPYCSHWMQPLDVSFMVPLTASYEQEVRNWSGDVTVDRVAELFGTAFLRAAVMQTAVEGFRKTGILPLNRDVFPDDMFVPITAVQQFEYDATQMPVDSRLATGDQSPSLTEQHLQQLNSGLSFQPVPSASEDGFFSVSPLTIKMSPRSEANFDSSVGEEEGEMQLDVSKRKRDFSGPFDGEKRSKVSNEKSSSSEGSATNDIEYVECSDWLSNSLKKEDQDDAVEDNKDLVGNLSW